MKRKVSTLTDHAKTRVYRGHLISPMGPNTWGGRWQVHVNGRFFHTETLADMKEYLRGFPRGDL